MARRRALRATARGSHFHRRHRDRSVGSFQPRRLASGIERFEGRSIYRSEDAAAFADEDLLIFGGGDAALDWTLELVERARSVVLVHRRPEFRAAPASVRRMFELRDAGRLDFLEGQAQGLIEADGRLAGATVRGSDGVTRRVSASQLLVFFGLHPRLGPVAEWGLELNRRNVRVDTERFATSTPGIFAVGDINDYPGKKKLILSGFHEAALAAFAIQAHLDPGKKVHLQYTTTSPIMHRRLAACAAGGRCPGSSAARRNGLKGQSSKRPGAAT
jgi:thioredoxin reductase (NADPH)